ncbi:related to succinate dehydrogenase [ubiquinone] cytochrome b small subunit, mitochondrial precursor [Melanopsichium pennsylvanicum]|uniref:Succinate dehydrogenase [ubiquinone] cytochrome b small subunit n=2 Tax=Melanopsichium pennsylvanicum TaxID=63383 RepID=A0AAJ4XNM1_9BASI|nr:related to succinate dehydrogenase [ubiquinone] cytochrome b small subunit, mitochondrial precursor [Melanopsichium pennsylvanicum 4]SNX85146.1 related to succinate dehydrogenase [ubiquinone] cytochrome b small subunit, mitochondrial precursor [Melanopsichium pennsylvanicum]
MRAMLPTLQQPLRLSMAARNPHLRMIAGGSRAFQTTHGKKVAASSQGPYVKGTVNDPTTFPEPNAAHGSNHWAFERGLSLALVPLVAVGFAKHGSSAILDGALALTLVVHSHIGFDCILADYLHKRKFPIAGPLSTWTLRAATLATLYGLYEFNTNDVGLTELIAKVWTA